MKHICIDIEALSDKTDAVIVSISAVKFSLFDVDSESFTVNVNPHDGKALGLHISTDTLNWWRTQHPDVVKSWMTSQVSLNDGLDSLVEFCGDCKETKFWSLGTIRVIESSFNDANKKVPWKFWDVLDMRTAYYLGGVDHKKEPRVGNEHNSLDDCFTLIKNLKLALKL